MKLREHRSFMLLWSAATVSSFGTYITTLALGFLVTVQLGQSELELGLVNAARWLPYVFLGLIAGTLVERLPQRRLLIVADLLRAGALGFISFSGLLGVLTVPMLIVAMVVFGAFSLIGDTEHQTYLPQLVPRELLHKANARVEQSDAVAQATGQLLAGGLIKMIGIPLAFLVDALSYVFSALVIWRIRAQNLMAPEISEPRAKLNLPREISEGVRWVYTHPRRRPLAISSHVWFIFNAMAGTVFIAYLTLTLHLDAAAAGLIFTGVGVGATVSTALTTRLGHWLGPGKTIMLSGAFDALGFALIALQATSGVTSTSAPNAVWQLWLPLIAGQFIYGLGFGMSGAHELAYRVILTPRRLHGRMSATMRSINRAMIVVGAPLGGALVLWLGAAPVFWIITGGFVASRLYLLLVGFASASYQEGVAVAEPSEARIT
ncbi:MFS transporter [Renibacterium salmoninarum]|nr:MFS transporter [Renibacterium salmoninarum]